MITRGCRLAVVCAGAVLVAGCAVGPRYTRPAAPTPPAYKEGAAAIAVAAEGWKVAEPQDATLKGKWWELFQDPELNALEEQVSVSNQNVAAAAAAFLAARAQVKEARAQYFPTITTAPSITASRGSATTSAATAATAAASTGAATTSTASTTSGTAVAYSLPFDASYQPDLWGRVRNTVLGSAAAAQVSAADLENTRLTMQAEVAVDYYQLRGQDALKQVLDSSVAAYREALTLTTARFQTGIDSDEDVAQAETQLESTEAQASLLEVQRSQYEHAIATLTGQPASTFSIPVEPLKANPPSVPVGIPSQLLERRPDIAAAERTVAQANAQIGVAKAAFFPTLTLSAAAGFVSSSLASWLTWPSRFWSVGPALAETLFDGGLRRATVEQYQAAYDQTVAQYRQTALTAFQQVEDNLAALRILARVVDQQDGAVKSAERNLRLATDRYLLGIDPYLNVITAQAALLTNQQAAVNFRLQQMTASVQLIEAVGGGWEVSQLPSLDDLVHDQPPAPKPTTP
jgi:NodT family efflux transporter outer membrane factor (OMF) lipoprotein